MEDKNKSHLNCLFIAIEQIADNLMITDKNGIIEYVNSGFEKVTGFSAKEIVGQNPRILRSGLQDDAYYRNLWETILAGKAFRGQTANKKKNGEIYYSDQTISAVKDEHGNIIHFISIANDITQMMELEKKLERLNKDLETKSWGLEKTNKALKNLYKGLEQRNQELQKLDQLKSDFVSTVSHELRTPLAISMEGVSLIIDGLTGEINDKQRKLLVTSKDNLLRLNAIINDLLDISKIESGKMDLHFSMVDLINVFERVADDYQRVVAKKKISLEVTLPKEPILIYIDTDKIIQVVMNLLNNAYKFTPEGGRVTLGIALTQDEVVCFIQDTGMGISPENQTKLFKKFQQFGRLEGPGIKGTGLGLTIAKALVELHHGKITVESKLNEGTCFSFSLPKYERLKADFDQDIDLALKADGMEALFIIIQLKNYDELQQQYGHQFLIEMMNKAYHAVSNVCSRPDDRSMLYDERHIHVSLPKTGRLNGRAMCSRLKSELTHLKFPSGQEKVALDFILGFASTSAVLRERRALISEALKDMSRKKHVLLVDDEPMIAELLRERFVNSVYIFHAVTDALQAQAFIKRTIPDLIVLDIMMPGMDGYALLGRLKENKDTASIPIVLLTAKDAKTVQDENADAAAFPIVNKTEGFDHLMSVIQQQI